MLSVVLPEVWFPGGVALGELPAGQQVEDAIDDVGDGQKSGRRHKDINHWSPPRKFDFEHILAGSAALLPQRQQRKD